MNAWSHSQSGLTETLGALSGAVYFYPAPASGFFVKGGAGLGNYRLGDGATAKGTGFGLLAGAGYDIRVGSNISITPVVNFWWTRVGDIKIGSTTIATGWKQNVIDVGLGVTFH